MIWFIIFGVLTIVGILANLLHQTDSEDFK